MSILGNLIKKARTRLGLSQKELGEQLEVPQGTISAWERGRQRPSDKALLDKLSECLKIERQQLADAYKSQSPEKVGFEPDGAVASTEQQHYIEEIGYEKAEIWLLGPSTLPVIESPTFQEIWAKNLSRGTTYCVLWYLDFVPTETFRKIAPALYNVEQLIKKFQQETKKQDNQLKKLTEKEKPKHQSEQKSEPIPGKMNHYATILAPDISLKSKLASYRELEQESLNNNLTNIIFHTPKQVNLPELLQYSNPYGALILYRDRQASLFKTPLVCISLASVKIRPSEGENEKPKRVFYFLPQQQADKLDQLIRIYLQSYNYAEEITSKNLFESTRKSSNIEQ
ncbi:MAG: helix-turn-helix domain-containing protein [Symploca sp. SIO2G7]|nr:helix-turn-helix domain-containing protein [Symploca sp. SIO2G7]